MHLPHRSRAFWRTGVPVAAAVALVLSGAGTAAGATTDPNPGPLELSNAALSKAAATQGMVLLENHDHALPMPKSGTVAVFGVGAYKTVKGGTGSGDVNNRYTITVRQGLENAGYTVTTSGAYWDAMTAAYDTKYGGSGGGLFGPAIDYSSVEQPLDATSVQPTAATDTALFVVARNSGEGSDRTSGQGDFQLTDVEKGDIALIGQTYQHVVVVLNTGGIVDTSFYREINAAETGPGGGTAVDSLLLMSQAGQESGNALAEVLNGTVTPSGHLTDTWASKYSYYPASATFANNDGNAGTENYSEGIYVGYRYFDSFFKTIDPADPSAVVDYPFGFGLSYTDFGIDVDSVKATGKRVTVEAKVTNTGKQYSGQEVVEVYFSAPQTGLDKPYQELAAYGKTDTLAPGASQELTIGFDTTQMSSFDAATSAYVMDAGDYLIRVGDSSRNTHVAAKIALSTSVVTTKVNSETADQAPPTELTSTPSDFYSYPGESTEIAKAKRISLNSHSVRTENDASRYEQNVPVDSTSPYYAIDNSPISSTTAYLDPKQSNWEGTGAAYQPKTGEKISNVRPKSGATLFDVARHKVSMEQFVAGLSVDQLANIVEGASLPGSTLSAAGAAGYSTGLYENIGIPQMTMSDGPAGLRITQQINTTPPTYQFATAWPIGTMLAQTWDRDLLAQVGTAIGKEMREYGATLWLAPGMNIHRDPLNGRNFEYFSEDPLIAGLTAAGETEGVQSNAGVGVTLKHYVANNQETQRSGSNSVIGERAAREIYLKGFELAVKAAQPMAIMTSYNRINGTYASANYDMNTDLLRGEWGFKGLVMTDWGGSHGAVATMYSGNDLIMPGNNPAEIVNTMKKVVPTIDVAGLPTYTKQTLTFGTFHFTRYTWQLAGFGLSATGGETISTTVDGSTDLANPQSGEITDTGFVPVGPYTSVADAFAATTALLDPTTNALNAGQRAAISLTDVTYATPGDNTSPVTAYTVVMKGSYPTSYDMRLGDVQRSAMRILNVAMQSAPFDELASLQGVHGIKVGSYTGQFRHLDQPVTVAKDKVRSAPGHHSHH